MLACCASTVGYVLFYYGRRRRLGLADRHNLCCRVRFSYRKDRTRRSDLFVLFVLAVAGDASY